VTKWGITVPIHSSRKRGEGPRAKNRNSAPYGEKKKKTMAKNPQGDGEKTEGRSTDSSQKGKNREVQCHIGGGKSNGV